MCLAPAGEHLARQPPIPFEQIKPDYLLWGCFRWSFASSSTPAGCLLQLIHGLDEGARGAKSQRKKSNNQRAVSFITRLLLSGCQASGIIPRSRTCSIDRRCATCATNMGLTNLYLLLSMSEVREPPVDCLLPSSRDLTSASFFLTAKTQRCRLGYGFEMDMSGINS
jgi:hypothetical protein